MAATGESRWPRVGRADGRRWGQLKRPHPQGGVKSRPALWWCRARWARLFGRSVVNHPQLRRRQLGCCRRLPPGCGTVLVSRAGLLLASNDRRLGGAVGSSHPARRGAPRSQAWRWLRTGHDRGEDPPSVHGRA